MIDTIRRTRRITTQTELKQTSAKRQYIVAMTPRKSGTKKNANRIK